MRFRAIGAGGDGVAEFEGRTVYAAHAAPGDVAIADICGDRAEVVEWVEKGPSRRDPDCPHVARCGGCALQHIAAAPYAAWKRDRVVAALTRERVDGATVRDAVPIAPATRRRATFAVRRAKGALAFGFNARRSSEIVAVDACTILHPDLRRSLPILRRLAGAIDAPAFDMLATLCDNGVDVDLSGTKLAEPSGAALSSAIAAARGLLRVSVNGAPVFTAEAPRVTFDGVAVAPPPGGFLQASREGEAALIGLVAKAAAGARRIADLFSGCGTFTLPLARSAEVEAFDADKAAIAALGAATKEAQRAGLALKARAQVRDLFELPVRAAELKRFDAVVFDPPRAGAKAQAGEIARSEVRLVIGVSCNPDSFARDAAILSQGGYRLVEVTPVDQFVYAPHVELVGVFRRT